MMGSNVINIIRNTSQLYSLSINLTNILVFKDSLIFGPLSKNQYCFKESRAKYWNEIQHTPLTLYEESYDYFTSQLGGNLFNIDTIVIWISQDPSDILMLWMLAFQFYDTFRDKEIIVNFIEEDLLTFSSVRIYNENLHFLSVLWRLYVLYTHNFRHNLKRGHAKHKPFIEYIMLSKIYNDKKDSKTWMQQNTNINYQINVISNSLLIILPQLTLNYCLLAPLDIEICEMICKRGNIAIANLITIFIQKYSWIGDGYILARINFLQEIGIVKWHNNDVGNHNNIICSCPRTIQYADANIFTARYNMFLFGME
ncbi:MAG: DUF1835 domain-containing protein [Planctomycetia bacterium]|nr:DUF1835 domain-containing protein [Planctomycetia bacterium]